MPDGERWDSQHARWIPAAPKRAPIIAAATGSLNPPLKVEATAAPIVVGSTIGGFQKRMYSAAKSSRLTGGWQTSASSADAELVSSLTQLRSRSRALIRDAAYAKRARLIVTNNVIGAGIGMQAQVMTSRGELNDRVNDDIEAALSEWSCGKYCHTGGTLHLSDMERVCVGQVFEAGEVLLRKHYFAVGGSPVPFTLELIEPERLADTFTSPTGPLTPLPGNRLRMGIEVDRFYRPVAYWIHQQHPGEVFVGEAGITDRIERVPADQIIHLRVVDRWPQSRGEPWLHAVVRKLNDMEEYSKSELVAARMSANYFGTIESTDAAAIGTEETNDADGQRQLEIEPGMIDQLLPGEEFRFHAPNRPNTALDPFMRYMLREVSAGIGVSYESLSKDYSQSNYSSSRLSLLDDRDLWRVLQQWFIRSFRDEVHREWLRQAVFARAISSIGVDQYAADPRKFEAVRYKPRGWSWIDPQKEFESRKGSVRAGFDTITNVIAETANGRDVEDIMRERRRELDLAEKYGLDFDTDVAEAVMPAPATPLVTDQTDAQGDATPAARVLKMRGNHHA